VPFRADAVLYARHELIALAATLRAASHPSEPGIALARRLLTDPAEPIYTDDGRDLREVARDIAQTIEEDRHRWT
jgi:hypothetical protein